jgi:hypothetical protein
MPFEPEITIKPATTKSVARPNTRATLRDLNSSNEIRVFRRPSLIRRLLDSVIGKRDKR